MYIDLHVKYLLFLQDFIKTWIFFRQIFRKMFKYKISWKSIQWEPSGSMRTDEHDEPYIRFSQFCKKANKN